MIRRATMNDIARLCGFSKMTVSRALAGRPGVRPEARRIIAAAATKLRYEVSWVAQSLNNNRSGVVGVATPWDGLIGSNFLAEIFRGFSRAMDESALELALFNTESESFNHGSKLAKLYRQRKVDGLLVVAPHSDDAFLKTLRRLHVPLVVVGEGLPDASICWIACDDSKGITFVSQYLFSLGHRKIAFIGGPENLNSAARRRKAFVDFVRAKALRLPPAYFQTGDYTIKGGREAARRLLKLSDRPTAIVAANDITAFGAMESARQLGISIPDELSITGFDDLPEASERYPSLTTVHQPVREMGKKSAKLLLTALAENKLPKGHTKMPVSLVVRESTGPCRKVNRTMRPAREP